MTWSARPLWASVSGWISSTGVLSDLSSGVAALQKVAGDVSDVIDLATNAANTVEASIGDDSAPATTTNSEANVEFPFFDDPSSILGLLFGQRVTFVNVDLGFAASVSDDPVLAGISLFGILTADLQLNINLNLDVGLSFGYDFDRHHGAGRPVAARAGNHREHSRRDIHRRRSAA